jgi:hypothetical protein
MAEMRNAYKIFVRDLKGRGHLWDTGIYAGLYKHDLEKQCVNGLN